MSDTRVPLAGVIGAPIGHSRSPQLHGHWLATLGLRGFYIPMEVSGENFEDVLRLLPKMGFCGVNITVPHKERALALADTVTDRARAIGASNTLVYDPDGRIEADNTDGYGFLENLRQAAPGWKADTGPAAVLGAGGAARAVIVALLEAGAPRILLSNRTLARAERLEAEFGPRIEVVDWVQAGNMLEDATTVVNTTSLGMTGNPPLRVPLDGLRRGAVVNDLVYAPLQTRLLAEAARMGCIAVDGLGMLLHQAVPGFERWFGVRPEVDAAAREATLK